MKLSDAILLGSTLNGQAFRTLRDDRGNSCAWGAAYKAAGISNLNAALDLWPWINQLEPCPDCGGSMDATFTIAHLNDCHKWTRERIAEWVATIEPQEPACTKELEEKILYFLDSVARLKQSHGALPQNRMETHMSTSRTIHVGISIRYMLNRPPAEARRMLGAVRKDDGTRFRDVQEFRDALMDALALGREMLPLSPECEGFDFKTGCPGHEVILGRDPESVTRSDKA